jgi:glycosyltransferase involved in cell wall biosynthesis
VGVIPYQDTCLNYRFCTPNKLFEFIAAALPVVASDLPEIARMIYEQGNGLVGNTADPASLAALIAKALEPTTHANLKSHAEAARKRVNWNSEGDRFAENVESLLSCV